MLLLLKQVLSIARISQATEWRIYMYSLLIVDDESSSRNGLKSFNWSDYNIAISCVATNGAEAFDYILSHKIDILLTDIKMPVMTGIELAEKVHSDYPEIIIVVLSGYDDYKYVRKCLHHGVFDYLLKPIDIEEFSTTFKYISDILDDRNKNTDFKTSEVINSKKHIASQVLEYMKSNYNKPISLSVLSDYIHVSPTYLSRVLKNETGVGYPELLNKIRVEQAKMLLAGNTLTINEISEHVGFSSLQYFSKIFKSITGKSPGEYRKETH